MDSRIKSIIVIINYTILTMVMIASALVDVDHSVQIIFFYLIVLSAYTGRTYFVYNNYENEKVIGYKGIGYREKKSKLVIAAATYLLEIFSVIGLQGYSVGLFSLVVLALIVEDIVVNTNIRLALVGMFLVYMISCCVLFIRFKEDGARMVGGILLLLPVYLIIFIIFYLINYMLRQNEVIEESLTNITIQNIEKDNLYKNLKDAYSKIEGITRLRERNKIAAEIHDTVGHTLTTVLVEIEAAKRLMNRDAEIAREKLDLAQGQVRKGLNDIRASVRVLEKGEELLDFHESLEALIEDTEKHSEVVIQRDIDIKIKLPKELEEILFSALMEGLSNGIRHGRSTAFLFRLQFNETLGYINFLLQDNGRGASIISPGFGLRAMKARVKEFNGDLEIISDAGEGFCLEIIIPIDSNKVLKEQVES